MIVVVSHDGWVFLESKFGMELTGNLSRFLCTQTSAMQKVGLADGDRFIGNEAFVKVSLAVFGNHLLVLVGKHIGLESNVHRVLVTGHVGRIYIAGGGREQMMLR